jgi:hypothetical protein
MPEGGNPSQILEDSADVIYLHIPGTRSMRAGQCGSLPEPDIENDREPD